MTVLTTLLDRRSEVFAANAAAMRGLVADLRETESSSYTERETPIFVGTAMPLARALDEIDGVAANVEVAS